MAVAVDLLKLVLVKEDSGGGPSIWLSSENALAEVQYMKPTTNSKRRLTCWD
jgi:hypothetical protein